MTLTNTGPDASAVESDNLFLRAESVPNPSTNAPVEYDRVSHISVNVKNFD
jgi:hypothetical protein